MTNNHLRLMRIWLVVHGGLNLISMSTYFIIQAYKSTHPDNSTGYEYTFEPLYWIEIIFSVILFFAYIYALFGKRVLAKHKRAVLMTLPTLMLFGFNIFLIDFEQRSGGGSHSFSGSFGTGLLALVEIWMAYKWGGHQPKNALYTSQGYKTGAQVTIISPHNTQQQQQQQHHQSQMGYSLQQPGGPVYVSPQPQQNYYYQQAPYQQQQQQQVSRLVSPLPTNSSTGPFSPPTQMYQNTPQQQQHQHIEQEFKGFAQPAPMASPNGSLPPSSS
ncbi:MAG: hypothetical protein J3R72DRAFT_518508 [Linnemannia gamsii]|nr:MAG: hypothetical protein J3R72DRAFT_518508 [Linnemannia gamsii]